jgi:predicted metal-dependent peptidase
MESIEQSDHAERLKNLIARFVLKYNYWGFLFSRIRRRPVKNLKSIMGVGAEPDGTISLFYEPDMLIKTDDEMVTKVIEHEGLHLLNKHIPRLIRILANETCELTKTSKSEIWNVAADCVVNSQAGFKEDFIIAGNKFPICLPEKYKLPPNKITEFYYLELLKNAKTIYVQSIGDHGNWTKNLKGVADLSSLSRKIDQHIRRIIHESVKSFNKERGRLPSHIAELIKGALEPPKAPYYQIIRKLVRGSRFSKFRRSPTKINRKRTYAFVLEKDIIPQISPFPGKTRDFTFDISVLLDTSGSMSIDDIKEGLSGVKNIIEKDRHCHTTVLEVDAGVEKEYTVRKIRDIQFNVKGRGGTVLGPGLFRAKELGCDVCLAFTDGFTEDINAYPRKMLPKKIIWVITPKGTAEHVNKTGFIVRI